MSGWLVLCAGLQIFLQAKPDVVILEVGIGGRIDATNIIKQTKVTGGGRSSRLSVHCKQLLLLKRQELFEDCQPGFNWVQSQLGQEGLACWATR